MKILVGLEQVGDPDDGMISVKTGCIDGNGKEVIAVINEKCIVADFHKEEMKKTKKNIHPYCKDCLNKCKADINASVYCPHTKRIKIADFHKERI